MSHLETSDKEILKRYNPNRQNRSGEICNYCGQPKKQFGSGKNRMDVCGCTGKQVYSKSGIPAKKSLQFKP